MKKLMIGAVIALAAICSQGAQVAWGVSTAGLMAPDGTNPEEDFLWTGTAFLYSGVVTASSSAFDFSKADYLDIATELNGETYTWGPASTDIAVEVDGADTAAGNPFTIIISDQVGLTKNDLATYEGNYLLITGETGNPAIIPPAKDGDPTIYIGKYLDETGNNYMGQWSTMTAGGSEGVPEPTSGLLMLVGLAGLALKRRHA